MENGVVKVTDKPGLGIELNEDVLNELKELDVSTLTPLDALNTIYRLQNKLKNRW